MIVSIANSLRAYVLCPLLSIPLVSSCAVLEDAGAGYPQGVTADRVSLVRSWGAGQSHVTLRGDGTFDSKGVEFDNSGCPEGAPDPGTGSWDTVDTGQGSTRIQLKFRMGCFGSLWVGQLDNTTVLWRETRAEKHEFIFLR